MEPSDPLSSPPLRIGIMGTANIARKNARAIHKSERCELVAVASRTAERASEWASHVAPWFGSSGVRALGSYEELLACADVEVHSSPECWAIYVVECTHRRT
jgi:predicted dehydrogenase